MNRSMKKTKRKKAAIPVYFQKNTASVSQILNTNSYKQRMKDVLKNNKELALYCQDVKIVNSHLQKQVDEYARENTQMMFAKTKMKDMATSIHKLACDLQDVMNCMSNQPCITVPFNRSPSDIRLRITCPNLTSIDESFSVSCAEDISMREDTPPRLSLPQTGEVSNQESLPSSVTIDNSVTEIYGIPSSMLLRTFSDCSSVTANSNSNEDLSVHEQTSPASPFKHIKATKNRKSTKEQANNPLSNVSTMTIPSIFTSKIPKMKHTPPRPQKKPSKDSLEASCYQGNRRETFVVKNAQEVLEQASFKNDRRGTFTVSQLTESVQNQCRRDTYFVAKEPSVLAENLEDEVNSRKTFFVKESVKVAAKPAVNRETFFVPSQSSNSDENIQGIPSNRGTYFVSEKPTTESESLPDQCSVKGSNFVFSEPKKVSEYVPDQHGANDSSFVFSKPNMVTDCELKMPQGGFHNTSLADCAAENRTVFLYEDMELTEVVPIFKNLKEAVNVAEMMPSCHDLKSVKPSSTKVNLSVSPKDVQTSRFNMPLLCNKKKEFCYLDVLSDSNQNDSPVIHDTIKESKAKSQDSIDTTEASSKVDVAMPSKRSLAKISQLENGSSDKNKRKSLKGRPSVISGKKSMKKSGKLSDVKEVGRKSRSKTSTAKHLSPAMPEVDADEADLGLKSAAQRASKRPRKIDFEKYFADNLCSDPEDDEDFVPGRKVNNLKEGFKAVNPRKKKRVTQNAESAADNDMSPISKENDDVFKFAASPEVDKCAIKKSKSKKALKPKSVVNKPECRKKDTEKVSKSPQDVIKNRNSVFSNCSEEEEDSFVITVTNNETGKDEVFSPVSRVSRKAPSRTCKKSSVTSEASLSPQPQKDVKGKTSEARCSAFFPLRPSEDRFSRKPSQKSKRTFSGVSERSSKRRTITMDSFDDLDTDMLFPKINAPVPRMICVDSETTELYNLKDMGNFTSQTSSIEAGGSAPEALQQNVEQGNIVQESKAFIEKKSQQMSLTEDFEDKQLIREKLVKHITLEKDKAAKKASHSKKVPLTEKQEIVHETLVETEVKDKQKVHSNSQVETALKKSPSQKKMENKRHKVVPESLITEKQVVSDNEQKVPKTRLKNENFSNQEPEMKSSIFPDDLLVNPSNKQKHLQDGKENKAQSKRNFPEKANKPIAVLGEIYPSKQSSNKSEDAITDKEAKPNHMKENGNTNDFLPTKHKEMEDTVKDTHPHKVSTKSKPKKLNANKPRSNKLHKKSSGLKLSEANDALDVGDVETLPVDLISQLIGSNRISVDCPVGSKDSISSVSSKESDQFTSGRPRRSRNVVSLKEPRLNIKMRR